MYKRLCYIRKPMLMLILRFPHGLAKVFLIPFCYGSSHFEALPKKCSGNLKKITANCLKFRQNPGKIPVKELHLLLRKYFQGFCTNFRYTFSSEQLSMTTPVKSRCFFRINQQVQNFVHYQSKVILKTSNNKHSICYYIASYPSLFYQLYLGKPPLISKKVFLIRLYKSTFVYTRLHSSTFV